MRSAKYLWTAGTCARSGHDASRPGRSCVTKISVCVGSDSVMKRISFPQTPAPAKALLDEAMALLSRAKVEVERRAFAPPKDLELCQLPSDASSEQTGSNFWSVLLALLLTMVGAFCVLSRLSLAADTCETDDTSMLVWLVCKIHRIPGLPWRLQGAKRRARAQPAIRVERQAGLEPVVFG